jgi:hypothetical protein
MTQGRRDDVEDVYTHAQTSSEQARKYKVAGALGCGWFGGIGLLGLALGSLSVGAFGIMVAAGLGALLFYLYRIYSSLTVRVDDEKVSVAVGARAPFEIPLGDISGCSVTPLPPQSPPCGAGGAGPTSSACGAPSAGRA